MSSISSIRYHGRALTLLKCRLHSKIVTVTLYWSCVRKLGTNLLAGGLYLGIKCACMCLPVRCRSFMTWCRSGMPCPLLYLRWCRGLSLSRSCMSKVTHTYKTCFVSSHSSPSHKTTSVVEVEEFTVT